MSSPQRFRLSPLIRFTLLTVYIAMVLPLPALAPATLRPWMLAAAMLGLALVWALLSEQVDTDDEGLRMHYPRWCSWLLRRSWHLQWSEIRGLVPVGTSQGGTVYYFTTHDQRHQLLPQRLSRFAEFLVLVKSHSGVDTSRIGRLTPSWTYQLLAALAVTMIIGEAALAFAIQQGWIISPVGGPG